MQKNTYLSEDSSIDIDLGPFYTHEYIDYYCLQGINWDLLNQKVSVQPNPNFGDWKEGPDHIDIYKEKYDKVREIPIMEAVDCSIRNAEFSKEIPLDVNTSPWKILVLYCTEPDMYLDTDLDLDWTQDIIGGSHAIRHMEVKLFIKKIGYVEKSLEYHLDAAKRSWDIGNKYWAWRFLSRATHYLADIGHPYHVKLAPTTEIFKNLRNFSHFKKMCMVAHNSHEVYTQGRFRQNYEIFINELRKQAMDGFNSSSNLFKEISRYRKFTVKNLDALYYATVGFGDDLISCYDLVKQSKEEDLSKTSLLAEKCAYQVIFNDKSHESLRIFDEITTKLLGKVGFMMGLLMKYLKESLFL